MRFAEQEKELFRWLYLEDGQIGPQQDDVLLPEILTTITAEYGYPKETARCLYRDMTFYSYGLAIPANTCRLRLSDSDLVEAFRRQFQALTSLYGMPPNEFQPVGQTGHIPLKSSPTSERSDTV